MAPGELVQVPQNATVVPGENATFHCDIVPASDDTVWRLQNEKSSSLMSTIVTKTFINRNVKSNAFNISAREVGNVYSSTLTILGDAESNFTQVQCIQLPAEIGNLESHFANITVAFLRVIGEFYMVCCASLILTMVFSTPNASYRLSCFITE